jgi:hypothetical protein
MDPGVLAALGAVLTQAGSSRRVVPEGSFGSVHEQLEAVCAAESSYPAGPGGEVRVPQLVRTLLESAQVRYVD